MAKKSKEVPQPISQSVDQRKEALKIIASESTFKETDYLFDDTFKKGDTSKFLSVHTVPELMEHLNNSDTEAEGVFLEANSDGVYRYKRLKNKASIQEAWNKNSKLKKFREANLREGFSNDNFNSSVAGSNAGLVGDDFVPLLGGPFNKQPYLYDYLRAHAYCFHEYHHHPFARAIVHMTRDFVLGRGYRIDCDDPKALALWRAFEKVNNLERRIEEECVKEGSIYGENFIWWLPNNEVNIAYQVAPGQAPARGIIPRIRFCDPSTCWEIVTFPEDIERVLYYQFIFPTQYQIFTGSSGGRAVPTSKFIMQQIPAEDMMHFKFNCVSNEKRGRSDLFPSLGYLKWVRDCVNYKLIALKKQAAWTEDISVEGSQTDVDNLAQQLANLGEFEPAGSRFIHTSKIVRQYMANQGRSSGDDGTLDWGINMIAVSSGIPASYFGLTHGSGQTRASAIVGTEPVAKKFERRQEEVRRILKAIWTKFQEKWGVPGADCTVTFPEIITQDRSQKLKDIKLTEDSGYIARRTAASMAAKELGVDDYDYDEEVKQIDSEKNPPMAPTVISPLTAPSATASPSGADTPNPLAGKPASQKQDAPSRKPSALTSNDRREIVMRDGT